MKIQTEKTFKIATIAFLALSMGMILFPIQRAPTLNEVAFVWNTEQLQGVHGAASQWDYLFEDNDTKTYGGQLGTDSTVPLNTSPYPDKTNSSTTHTNTTDTSGNTSGSQGTFGTSPMITTGATHIQTATTTSTQTKKDCRTPWGDLVKDQEFILAYQQRTDAETMCNIEKRVCNDGKLAGSYIQQSCKENITYNYQRAKVISYNEKIVDPLIQPGPAQNAGASFSTEGKINQTTQPTTTRGSTNNGQVTTASGVKQTTNTPADCATPWGTKISYGQFVKAYKSSIGLLDMPCETELRLCVNGTLKGTFLNKSCTIKNMTYSDYLIGNYDVTSPTPQDITDTLTTDNNAVNLFDRIRKLFE